MAKPKSLRPSRDEREPYLSAINEALADGRIDEDEASTRIDRVAVAISFDDLDELVVDIPFEWRDERLERAQQLGRRRFVLGAVGFLGVGAASWAGTRAWVKSAAADEGSDSGGAGSGSADSQGNAASGGETASDAEGASDGESVPTDLVQVRNWRKDTVPSAIDHAVSMGLTTIARIYGGGDDLTIKGADKKDQWASVDFAKAMAPRLIHEDDYQSSDKWLKPDRFRDIDVSALYREVKSELAPNAKSHLLDIGYDLTAEQWLITIADSETSFSWTLDGSRRVKTR